MHGHGDRQGTQLAHRLGDDDRLAAAGGTAIVEIEIVLIKMDGAAIAAENDNRRFLGRQFRLVLGVMILQAALVAAQAFFQCSTAISAAA